MHLGAVGRDGDWLLERLECLGVERDAIVDLSCALGHAITLFSGANTAMSEAQLTQWLAPIGAGDWLVMQNETAHQLHVA